MFETMVEQHVPMVEIMIINQLQLLTQRLNEQHEQNKCNLLMSWLNTMFAPVVQITVNTHIQTIEIIINIPNALKQSTQK